MPAIIHIDMDAFYASVEQRDNPALRGLPVVVGGAKDSRGVVSTASYEARLYGVRSAMSMTEAVRRCPECIYLPVDMAKYRRVSAEIMAIFRRYTPLVEAISLDEAFLDVTQSRLLFGDAAAIGRAIKAAIKEETALIASVGIAGNKFLAKLASELGKPDGFYQIGDDELAQKVWPLSISKMMGVGKKNTQILTELGFATIGQLAQSDPALLAKTLGKQGWQLHQLANGIDPRPVEAEREIKSVGREVTFPQDITDAYQLETILMDLTEDVAATLRRKGLKGRTIHLKIRYDDFSVITRAVTLDNYTAGFERVFAAVRSLFRKNYASKRPVRLIGMSVSHLACEEEIVEQLQLFDLDAPSKRQDKLDQVLDKLNQRYGGKIITRARQMEDAQRNEEKNLPPVQPIDPKQRL